MSEVLVSRFECNRITLAEPDPSVAGESGLFAFIRHKGGRQLEAIVPVEREEYPVTPDKIAYVCRNLEIEDPRDLTHEH